jgi:hypothetical protein
VSESLKGARHTKSQFFNKLLIVRPYTHLVDFDYHSYVLLTLFISGDTLHATKYMAYESFGTLTDFANPAVTFTEQETSLITMGPTSVYMVPRDLGIPGYLIRNGVSLSYYGGFGPVFHFDPSSNKITAVVNYYIQPASNPRTGELDPSGSNQYDPAIKAMTVKFWLNEPVLVTTPPHHRVVFTNTLLYLGPRY